MESIKHHTASRVQTPSFFGLVAPEWLSRGTFLNRAWRDFPSQSLDEAIRWASVFSSENGWKNPETALDYAVANWQAAIERDDGDLRAARMFRNHMRLAEMDIKNRLQGTTGWLMAFGRRDTAAGEFEWIPTDTWFHLKVDNSKSNYVTGGGVSYFMVQVINPCEPKPAQMENKPATRKISPRTCTRQYVKQCREKGITPTQMGLLSAFMDEGGRGHRKELKDLLAAELGASPKPGRPRRSNKQ